MTTTTFRIDEKLLGLLKIQAAREGRTMKDLAEELIRNYLKLQPEKTYDALIKELSKPEQVTQKSYSELIKEIEEAVKKEKEGK